jgi:hypothetical protein
MALHSKSIQSIHPSHLLYPSHDPRHHECMVDKTLAWIFAVIRFRSIAHPKTVWRRKGGFHVATCKSLPNAYTPVIFRIHRMIRGITSTWSTRLWLGFFPEFDFGQQPTRKAYRVISTADSATLHSKSMQYIHPIHLLPPWCDTVMTSTWSTRCWLGFFPEFVFGQ